MQRERKERTRILLGDVDASQVVVNHHIHDCCIREPA
jgi:hypothetical protein